MGLERIKPVKFGRNERMSFSKTKDVLPIPNLIEVQKHSYDMFINDGIREVFDDFSPITDFSNHFELRFLKHSLEGKPKFSESECRERDATYALPLKIQVQLIRKDTGEITEQELFMGDFPLMTDNGSFIINGAERVVVSQLVRSPGVYVAKRYDKNGYSLYDTTVIPNRGAWLEFVQDQNNILHVHVDRNRKLPATVLLRAIGLGINERLYDTTFQDVVERYEDSKDKDKDKSGRNIDANIRFYKFLYENGISDEVIASFDKDENEKSMCDRGLTQDQARKLIEYVTRMYPNEKQIGKQMQKLVSEFRGGREIIIATFGDDDGYELTNGVRECDDDTIVNTCEKDTSKNEREGLVELYKRLRPGEIPTEDSIKKQLHDLLFDAKRYDLAKVGRYKFNKKLSLANRVKNRTLAKDVVLSTGEVIAHKGELLSYEKAYEIQHKGINVVYINSIIVDEKESNKKEGKEFKKAKVIGNNVVDLSYFLNYYSQEKYGKNVFFDFEPRSIGITEYVNFTILNEILSANNVKEDIIEEIKKRKDELSPKHITREDIIATVSYNLGLKHGIGMVDNIDHLGNRRVRSVGELLQNQFRVGIARLERVIKERMAIQEADKATPQTLINVRPVSSAIKEFFGSSQLSQFMDQTNPIAELTHKRKLSALGPGGLNRERATIDVRDVHHSHYGRMCPVETPEGQNIGLISSLASYARINEYGFIESPYRKVDKENKFITNEIHYLSADEEDDFIVAQANEELDDNGFFKKERVTCRERENIAEYDRDLVDYMDVSPKQLVSIATSLIPFLETDDTGRALMGSNMQRQAVPLLVPEAPIVATGIEHRIAYDSGVMVLSKVDGIVCNVCADRVKVKDFNGDIHSYQLKKFVRSNAGTSINQKPIVNVGDVVKKGDILADGPSTCGGELALGRNILIGFMSWEGYNYEDAILISEKLVKEDTFTTIHIEEHETETRETRLGAEEITRDIPNVGEDALKDLDENGIIRIGAEVRSGDILVGKVTPKGETELTPEERLLRAIFSEKAREVRDTSLKVPNGEGGIVVDVKIFTRENKDELDPGVNKLVRVYIAQKRKMSIGDKMAGRHGNKGVISRILPEEDMPFMEDGTPLQIVLNPLGVPSRMNIGQVLEVHLGLIAKMLGWKISTPVFDGATEQDIKELFEKNGIVNPETGKVDGKVVLYDGRTGLPFENRVTVGYMYMLKLIHLVDDKIHARSTGPYSLVTQQPLGGKAQFGGQRFGEMEVWALEAYGAANILQEILTVKSDDVVGRVKTFESIIKGQNVSDPGIPESFKVLIKELQSLCLDVRVLGDDLEEINVRDSSEEDTDSLGVSMKDDRDSSILVFDEDDDMSTANDGMHLLDDEGDISEFDFNFFVEHDDKYQDEIDLFENDEIEIDLDKYNADSKKEMEGDLDFEEESDDDFVIEEEFQADSDDDEEM